MNNGIPAALVFCLCSLPGAAQAIEKKTDAKDHFDFGKVGLDGEIEHTFPIRNEGAEAIEILHVQLTPPLIVTKMPVRIEPGAEAAVTVRLEKPHKAGRFEGAAVVHFKSEARKPAIFYVQGDIHPPVEFVPFKGIFISTQRGQAKSASLEVVNHEAEPFEIKFAQHDASRFQSEVTVIEPGRRFRLTVTAPEVAPPGRNVETIRLVTTSTAHPALELKAHTLVKERVYTFPDSVDLGSISTNYLKAKPQMVGFLTRPIMVYQSGGSDFQISASVDVPFLRVHTHRGTLKDRFEIQLTVIPEQLKAGEVNAALVIATNDPEFPKLTIPVTAVVEGNW